MLRSNGFFNLYIINRKIICKRSTFCRTRCVAKTVISREYSSEWKLGDEPYYPVNDAKNGALYEKYKELAKKEEKVIFGGRLGEYKYYDMDAVIASALELVKKEL